MVTDAPPRRQYLDPETLQRLGSLELIVRHVVEGVRIGLHKSPLRGFSTEFAHHRQYVPGDPIRHLDWRVYSRSDRYYLKLYEAETDFTAYLLLDASSSMHYRSGRVSKLEYAKYIAASLAHLVIGQRDAVSLAVFDDKLRHYLEPSSAPSAVTNVAKMLEGVQPVPRTNVAALLHEFAERITRRGVVILFSDLLDQLDGFLKGLDHLRFRGHNVMVFQTLDKDELTFPFDGTCKFRGLEVPEELLTRPKRVQEAYLAELKKFLAAVRKACEGCQVDYMLVDTSRPVDVVLSEALLTWQRTI
jgi:uncharacterized protein (DUF58 family)